MNKKIKIKTDILFLSHTHLLTGGGEKALMDQVVYLASMGINVHVIVGAKGDFSKALDEHNIPHTFIGTPWWVRAPGDTAPYEYSGTDPRVNVMIQIINLITELEPKVCVTNTIVTPWLAYASSIMQVKHVWQVHEMGSAGQKLSYQLGEKQTIETIGYFSDGIFFNSKTTSKYYESRIPASKNKGVIYPSGSIDPYEPIDSPFSDRKGLTKLISVGQIKPQKGQFDTVKAVHKLKNEGFKIEIILVGDFEDKAYAEKINNYIRSNDLENEVRLVGFKCNPNAYVEHADISIMSAQNEAFGRVTVEAMLLGKPVIGAESGGTREIITDHHNGILYTADDSNDLAGKIKELNKSPELLQKLGSNAKEYASSTYSDSQRFKSFIEYYSTNADKEPDSINLSPLACMHEDYMRLILGESYVKYLLKKSLRVSKRGAIKATKVIRKQINKNYR